VITKVCLGWVSGHSQCSSPTIRMGADLDTRGQLQTPAALPLGKSPLYSIYRRLGGSQCPSGQCEFEKNVLALPEIEPRPSNSPLYRLSYPSSFSYYTYTSNKGHTSTSRPEQDHQMEVTADVCYGRWQRTLAILSLCFLVTSGEGKRPLGRPWRRWMDYIEMDIRQIG
jgi:hypothetical protein